MTYRNPINLLGSSSTKIAIKLAVAVLLFGTLFAAALPARATDTVYRLAPGDVVHIQLSDPNMADRYSGDFQVQPDGRVRLATTPVTSINADGLTLAQFEAACQNVFARYLRYPGLTVTLRTGHPMLIYTFGAFEKTGSIPLTPGMHLLEALAAAGGSPDGDLAKLVLKRGTTTRIVNAQKALESNGQVDNIELQPDDMLFAPARHAQVRGQVGHPGEIVYRSGMTLEDAIVAAGGLQTDADLTRITITHTNGTQDSVDIKQAYLNGDKIQVALQPDDIITIPQVLQQVAVGGEVARPVTEAYRPFFNIEDALALAGGETSRADLAHVKIARADPPGVETVDLAAARKAGKSRDILLKPGDTVSVPDVTGQVYVLGWVKNPGPFPFKPDITVLDAFAAAGGAQDTADVHHATLIRASGVRTQIDLDQITREGDTSKIVKMEPGDTLYLGEYKKVFYVFGDVTHSGAFPYPEGESVSLLDVVGRAGVQANADFKKATVSRPENGKIITTRLDLDKLEKGDLHYNTAVLPGDVIYVPARPAPHGSVVDRLPFLLSILYPLYTIFHL